mgnify:CR=1 FL=1
MKITNKWKTKFDVKDPTNGAWKGERGKKINNNFLPLMLMWCVGLRCVLFWYLWDYRQYGTRESKEVTVNGESSIWFASSYAHWDCFLCSLRLVHGGIFMKILSKPKIYTITLIVQVMQRDYKLSSYSLNSVSARFVNEQARFMFSSLSLSL